MDKAELIREIAAVMSTDPDGGFREFEWQIKQGELWVRFTYGWGDLLSKAEKLDTYRVRRRPRTIKVSGEVSEEAAEAARGLWSGSRKDFEDRSKTIALALLDLIEQSEDK